MIEKNFLSIKIKTLGIILVIVLLMMVITTYCINKNNNNKNVYLIDGVISVIFNDTLNISEIKYIVINYNLTIKNFNNKSRVINLYLIEVPMGKEDYYVDLLKQNPNIIYVGRTTYHVDFIPYPFSCVNANLKTTKKSPSTEFYLPPSYQL